MAAAKVGIGTLTVDGTGQRIAVYEPREPSRSYGCMFRTTFETESADLLVKQINSAPTLKVLAILPRKLSYEVFRRVDQAQLAVELDISTGAASRAMNELHELGFLERQGRGPVTMWRLSSDYGWRGSVDGFHAFQRQKARQAPQVINPPAEQSQKEYYANLHRGL